MSLITVIIPCIATQRFLPVLTDLHCNCIADLLVLHYKLSEGSSFPLVPKGRKESEMTQHQILAVSAVEASGPGALSGHEFRCSCGEVQRTSLSASEAQLLAQAHKRFWASK